MRRRRAFTLVELMAVVVLLAVAIGVSTLGMPAVSDQARVESAASQIGSICRLAAFEASASGMPRVVRFDPHGFVVRKPVYRENGWEWVSTPRVELIGRVRISRAGFEGSVHTVESSASVWEITIRPGPLNSKLLVEMSLRSGRAGVAGIDVWTGNTTFEWNTIDR